MSEKLKAKWNYKSKWQKI